MNLELLEKAQAAGRLIEPADLHGTVCGMACSNPHTFNLQDLIDLIGLDALEDEEKLHVFVAAALDELHAQDMEFAPLLPDDEHPLPERIAGLVGWCAGFLGGFAAGLSQHQKELPDEVQEIVRDFTHICQLDEEDEASEQNEHSFMEIFEYVRVGAVLVLSLMQQHVPEPEGPDASETLH
ncbi:MAG: UPF0149 family protein [Pseudomonadota bacterium]